MIHINIIESYTTKNKAYIRAKALSPSGLMLHSIGCAQPSASVLVGLFDSPTADSVHAFIDANDGNVHQTLPWTYVAGHCGSGKNGSANNTHIAVEMCEPKEIVYTKGAEFVIANNKLSAAKKEAKTAYNSAVELFAYLCNLFNLDPLKDGVILSHNEGRERGIASSHVDPEHLWTGLNLPYTMDGFRNDVSEAMSKSELKVPVDLDQKEDTSVVEQPKELYRVRKSWSDTKSQIGAYKVLENAKKCADENPGYSVFSQNGSKIYSSEAIKEKAPVSTDDKNVLVSVKNLNIRTGPGTNYPPTGQFTGEGVFTIVKTKSGQGSSSGWGLLKTYAKKENGWISLDYAQIL